MATEYHEHEDQDEHDQHYDEDDRGDEDRGDQDYAKMLKMVIVRTPNMLVVITVMAVLTVIKQCSTSVAIFMPQHMKKKHNTTIPMTGDDK